MTIINKFDEDAVLEMEKKRTMELWKKKPSRETCKAMLIAQDECYIPDYVIDEYYADACYNYHKMAFEEWPHGEIKEIWRDENEVLCIRYSDGAWWHYSDKEIVWW